MLAAAQLALRVTVLFSLPLLEKLNLFDKGNEDNPDDKAPICVLYACTVERRYGHSQVSAMLSQ
jgi:hypothetical protein